METRVIWKEGMAFEGRAQGFSIPMDAIPPLGHHFGPSPKELVALGLGGCTGMDVVGILKKHKQFVDRFEIETQIIQTKEHPVVFSSIELTFKLEGAIDPAIALRAVELSQTTYCGVSAMLFHSAPINWSLFVNGDKVGAGLANFEKFTEVYQSTFEG